jgi:hypothetical protein
VKVGELYRVWKFEKEYLVGMYLGPGREKVTGELLFPKFYRFLTLNGEVMDVDLNNKLVYGSEEL